MANKKMILPSIMVADLHSSISQEPEIKPRGVGRGRREEARGYRYTAELMGKREAVANALTICEPPIASDVTCQLSEKEGKKIIKKRERRRGGVGARLAVDQSSGLSHGCCDCCCGGGSN